VMRPVQPEDSLDGPEFPAATVIRDALHVAASTDKPIRVIDGGKLVGVVDRAQILEAVAGPGEPSHPGAAGGTESVPRRSPPVRVETVIEPTQETAEFLIDDLNDRADRETRP